MKKTTDLPCATRAKRCWKHGLLTLAVSMLTLPSLALEGIRPETQELVRLTQAKHPDLRLSDDAKRCLMGIEKDPECDEFINDEIKEFIRERQIAERERRVGEERRQVGEERRQVDERNRQVNMAREAVENIHIARALLQTVLYREFGQAPSADDDYRTKVQGYTTMRPEIRALIQRHLLEPAPKNQAAWKNDLSQAMTLAKECTDAAIGIQKKLTDTTLLKNIGAMNASFVDYYQVVKRKVSYTK